MNKKGAIYEDIAVNYLKNNGYEIIERNFSVHRVGEIDIIALEKDWLIFIEVKARRKTYYLPYECVNKSKFNKIVKTSAFYLKKHNKKYNGIRYDVISIEIDEKNNFKIEHIKNVFTSDSKYYL